MDDFWKTTALVLLTVILSLSLDKTERDISAVMGIVALCIAACAAAVSYTHLTLPTILRV